MPKRTNHRTEFLGLLAFLAIGVLVFTNGFSAHIFAQEDEAAIFDQIEPIGDVLSEIMRNYVYEPDIEKAVEGALMGIMHSLDRNSSYIPPESLKLMQEETQGAFDGIGIHIKLDEDENIMVFQPIAGSPAAKAGLHPGDLIHKIDGVSATGMSLSEAARRIKGPRGQIVHLTILRMDKNKSNLETLEFDVKRGKIPLESIVESRMLGDGVAYIRISDFKKNTAKDMRLQLAKYKKENMRALVLDLRWNPGGLLSASREVSELFLPKNTLVTSTKGRKKAEGRYVDNLRLRTERPPVLPEQMPMLILVGGSTASSSEIVTGALQFHRRAIIVGEKTFGKGSVQTIIPLNHPKGSALRLTTALYYTPADVTINGVGILPDVEVKMDVEHQNNLLMQMARSFSDDAELRHRQNHGRSTGNTGEDDVQDTVLERAIEILSEEPVFENILRKYHRDTKETQVAAAPEEDGAHQ